jgi:hypothetical protein
MRLTKNRELILGILDSKNNDMESDYGYPPFTCSSVRYRLKEAYENGWLISDMSVEIVPSAKQIERTMRDLVALNLAVVTKKLTEVYGSLNCDKFVNHYELPHQTLRNQLIPDVHNLQRKVNHITGRCLFTGRITPKTIDTSSYEGLAKSLKSMMGKTHPDKLGHNEFSNEFIKLKKDLDFLREAYGNNRI